MKTIIILLFILAFSIPGSATAFSVNSSADTSDANTSDNICADANGNCTLRAAIEQANAKPTDDTVTFDQNIVNISTSSQIIISANGSLEINGSGANRLTITGNENRIFYSTASVVIRNLTLTGGGAREFPQGDGGAIVVTAGTLTLSRVILRNNTGNGGAGGGGILISGGSNHRIEYSTITENTASTCGGVRVESSSISISNSTISNNISANRSDRTSAAGGLCFLSATGTIRNSTITGNRAITTGTFTGGSIGGGIVSSGSSISLGSTIVAENLAQNYPEIQLQSSGSLTSDGYNLVGDATGDASNTQYPIAYRSTDILDTPPLLGELQNNGGTTPTRIPLNGSPTIDKGFAFETITDQRGLARPFDNPTIPNAPNGGGSDIGAVEVRGTAAVPVPRVFDFDGDGRADVAVFRPSNGNWFVLPSQSNSFYGFPFGQASDQIAPADFDGDGKTDVAVFRDNVTGAGDKAYFYILNSSDNSFRPAQFGTQGDVPMTGDWDGDGKADLAVYRAATTSGGQSYFYYRPSSQPTVDYLSIALGTLGDKPLLGDFDGDGRLDPAVFRASTATWYIIKSSVNQLQQTTFGVSTDIPVPADYDGDGTANIAVFRPSNGYWYTSQNPATNYGAIQFGASSDLPVAADFDGDGKADVAIFRPSSGAWYVNRTTAGFYGVQFGVSGDKPAPNAFIR